MSEPIRVAFAITELEPGGAERCLVNLATRIDRSVFAPAVYCLAPRPSPGRDQLLKLLDEAAIPTHFLNLQRPWQLPLAVRRLRSRLARQNPHVVQTFLFHANVVGALAAGRCGPAIATGVRVADPSRWRQCLEAWTSRRVDRVVCVSQAVADACADRGRFPPHKLCVIPNGIDLDAYPPGRSLRSEQVGLPAGRRCLLFVGRLHRQKSADWLLSLAPQLLGPLADHDLALAGDGPQRQELQGIVDRLHLTNRVHFLGWRRDVPQLLAAADMLLLPSRWEGMPNVVLEAMASQRPVAASRAAGVLELLGPLADEQSADFGDRQAFIEIVLRLARDRQAAERLGQANRRRVAELFSLGGMVQAYEQLFCSLAHRTR